MHSDNDFNVAPPRDANGEVIPLDTEVLYRADGQILRVYHFRYVTKEKRWAVCGYFEHSNKCRSDTPSCFLLTPPDSWDKLIKDLRKAVEGEPVGMCKYLNQTGKGCIECRAQSYDSCSTCMIADIANRIEKLRGESNDH